jgi:Ca2+:H+ antiporter
MVAHAKLPGDIAPDPRSGPGWLNVLLLAAPAAFAIRFIPGWRNDTLIFIVAGIAVIPLAGWMGRATEQLAERTGPAVGALLNATLGNAAELIIALLALKEGLAGVVKASLTGSIIGNVLLVLGVSIFAGGLRYPVQRFNEASARAAATSLSLAAMGLLIPTVFHHASRGSPGGWSPLAEQRLSAGIAAVLLICYVGWLVFSLGTHRHLTAKSAAIPAGAAEGGPAPAWSLRRGLLVLVASTVLVAGVSELLVGSIEAARQELGLTETFVGVIVVAVVGNAAEHSTAFALALKNKMDLSLGIAIGSSLQVALFVTPVLVFASYGFGRPMNLEFSLPELAAVTMAVWTVVVISGDGECNWFEGLQLLAVYMIFALLFFFLPGH